MTLRLNRKWHRCRLAAVRNRSPQRSGDHKGGTDQRSQPPSPWFCRALSWQSRGGDGVRAGVMMAGCSRHIPHRPAHAGVARRLPPRSWFGTHRVHRWGAGQAERRLVRRGRRVRAGAATAAARASPTATDVHEAIIDKLEWRRSNHPIAARRLTQAFMSPSRQILSPAKAVAVSARSTSPEVAALVTNSKCGVAGEPESQLFNLCTAARRQRRPSIWRPPFPHCRCLGILGVQPSPSRCSPHLPRREFREAPPGREKDIRLP